MDWFVLSQSWADYMGFLLLAEPVNLGIDRVHLRQMSTETVRATASHMQDNLGINKMIQEPQYRVCRVAC
jgi:hypothetical protein